MGQHKGVDSNTSAPTPVRIRQFLPTRTYSTLNPVISLSGQLSGTRKAFEIESRAWDSSKRLTPQYAWELRSTFTGIILHEATYTYE